MPDAHDHAAAPPPALDPAPTVLIVTAPYYRAIADALIAGASAVLDAAGATSERLEVPGALEIAPAIHHAAAAKRFDGFVALGCVIRGATTHYELVCNESARGLTLLSVARGLCVGNGVLTVENREQAVERSEPDRLDKGGDAARACLHLIAVARRFQSPPRGFAPDDEHILLA